MSKIDDLRALGYRVEESHPETEETKASMYVEGFGIQTYVFSDDMETFASLLASHESRVEAMKSIEEEES